MSDGELNSGVKLSTAESWTLLREAVVGRLAVMVDDHPEIFPVNHMVDRGSVVFRSAAGTKLAGSVGHLVAFEVDEVSSLFDWRSVVVHGGVYELLPDATPESRALFEKALHLLRRLLPATFREDDPVPFRDVIIRIAVQEATGRRAIDAAD